MGIPSLIHVIEACTRTSFSIIRFQEKTFPYCNIETVLNGMMRLSSEINVLSSF